MKGFVTGSSGLHLRIMKRFWGRYLLRSCNSKVAAHQWNESLRKLLLGFLSSQQLKTEAKNTATSTSHGILRTMCRSALVEMWWFNKWKPHQGARPASLRMIGLNTVNLQRSVFIWGGFDFLLSIVADRFSVSIAPLPTLGSQSGCIALHCLGCRPTPKLWEFKSEILQIHAENFSSDSAAWKNDGTNQCPLRRKTQELLGGFSCDGSEKQLYA